DGAGNMTKIPNASWSNPFNLTYDAWNRLTVVNDGQDDIQKNSYDGLGRRIRRNEAISGGDLLDYYYNESWQLLEQRRNGSSSPDRQYVWHPYYVDALALTYNSSGADQYYLQDANFNITAVTDNGGAVLERYAYSPYGDVTVLSGSFGTPSGSTG